MDLDPTQDLSPVTNHDAQEALSRKHGNGGIWLLPLESGAIAIFDRSFQLHMIVNDEDETISYDQVRGLSKVFFNKLTSRAAEAQFYGEPKDRAYARDLKAARTPKRSVPPPRGEVIEVEI